MTLTWSVVRASLRTVPPGVSPMAASLAEQSSYSDAVRHMLGRELELAFITARRLNLETGLTDLAAVLDKDPALQGQPACVPLLFFKGFKAIQAYRMAHILWNSDDRMAALAIQSRCSTVWAVDIHPAASIGESFLIDHGTGVVIGETARVGENCVMLHNVTLGGKGGANGLDRHPKLGNNVTLGCNSTILGNLKIGNNVTVGAGAVVTKDFPNGNVTLVGSPAKPLGGHPASKL